MNQPEYTQQQENTNDKASSKPTLMLNPYVVVFLFSVMLSTWLIWLGVPCITSDHAVYHSPAAEFVGNGRMAIPCFKSLFPQTEDAFGCYPPLFQFLLSGWYATFGFSLRTALAFHFVIHLLSTLAIMRLTERFLDGTECTTSKRWYILLAVGVIHTTNLTNFDRQEETALLCLWIEMLFVQGPVIWRCLLSGLMISLAGLISPWVGLLGASVFGFRTLIQGRMNGDTALKWRHAAFQLLAAGLMALLPVLIWAFYMEHHYPGILNDQFLGTMRYIAAHRPQAPSVLNNLDEFWNTLLITRPQLPVLFVTAALFLGQNRRYITPNLLAIYITSMLALIFLLVTRPEAYTYVGAVEILLLPCFIPALSRYLLEPATDSRFGYLLLFLFTLFASQKAVQEATVHWRWIPAERHDEVYRRLREVIPPGELVNVTGRHWDVFQGRNPWLEAAFLMDEPILLEAKWMVLRVNIGVPPCIDAFELIEKIPTTVDRDDTYAYSLWRRKTKKE
jgi:hypothetical protein